MDKYTGKKTELRNLLKNIPQPICAYSGGVDSGLLAFLCHRENPETKIVFGEMTTLAKDDIEFALAAAKAMRLPLEILPFDPLVLPQVAANTKDRCYYCKHLLFTEIGKRYPAATLLDGSNADDYTEFRPGRKALTELKVRSPLAEAGFTKAEIRRYAEELQLPAAQRRSKPCLLTRFPYNLPGGINDKMLRKVAKGEQILAEICRDDFRLRWLNENSCRLEATPADCLHWEHTVLPSDFPFAEVLPKPTEHCSGGFDRIAVMKEPVL